MPAPWVGLHLKRTSKNAEATHATHTSTLGNRDSVLAGGEPNHFGAPPALFCYELADTASAIDSASSAPAASPRQQVINHAVSPSGVPEANPRAPAR